MLWVLYVSRLRLRVSHRDPSLVVAQGATKRSYRPFAQAFGKQSETRAELIVTAVNCNHLLVKALEAAQRTAMAPVNGNGQQLRARLSRIGHYAAAALSKINE